MLLIITVVYAFPLFQNINYSLRDLSVAARPFTGLRNYGLMLRDPIFLISIRNNFILIFTIVPVLVFLALLLAGALFEQVPRNYLRDRGHWVVAIHRTFGTLGYTYH